MLSDPDCLPFINELLDKAAEQNKGNAPFSTDPLKVFDEINSRGGYNYSTRYGFNTVSSSLQYANAAVLLVPPSNFGHGRWPEFEKFLKAQGIDSPMRLSPESSQYERNPDVQVIAIEVKKGEDYGMVFHHLDNHSDSAQRPLTVCRRIEEDFDINMYCGVPPSTQ